MRGPLWFPSRPLLTLTKTRSGDQGLLFTGDPLRPHRAEADQPPRTRYWALLLLGLLFTELSSDRRRQANYVKQFNNIFIHSPPYGVLATSLSFLFARVTDYKQCLINTWTQTLTPRLQ